MQYWAQLPLIALLLGGCAIDTQSKQSDIGAFTPSGPVLNAESVDGLVVGHRLTAAGEYELALKAYLRAAAHHGLTAEILTALGSANLKLGRVGQAEEQLRQAIRQDGQNPAAWNNLGVILVDRNDTAEAVRVFRTAFALDRGKSDLIAKNLERALAQQGEISYHSDKKPSGYDLVKSDAGSFVLRGI